MLFFCVFAIMSFQFFIFYYGDDDDDFKMSVAF